MNFCLNITDIDLCLQSPCHESATCTNTLSGYSCKCNQGYIGDGERKCEGKSFKLVEDNNSYGERNI